VSMTFNDFLNKRGFTAGPYVVTETEILSFAEKYDPRGFILMYTQQSKDDGKA